MALPYRFTGFPCRQILESGRLMKRNILYKKWMCNQTEASTQSVTNHLPTKYGFTRRPSDAWPEPDLAVLPDDIRPRPDETLDLILRQKLYLLQSRRGYRANTDSHVLACFASDRYTLCATHHTSNRLRVLDLGAGSGIVSILFGLAHPQASLHLLELQPQLVDRARRNLYLNNLKDGIVTQHDLKDGDLPEGLCDSFDVVLVNPPFYTPECRKPSHVQERHLAQLESSAAFSDFMKAARIALNPNNPQAFIAVIHDITELPRIRKALSPNFLSIKSAREMRHLESEPPSRILLHIQPKLYASGDTSIASCEPSPLTIKPLILHPNQANQNTYNDEIERFLEKLPIPKLRIGRLRDSSAPYSLH